MPDEITNETPKTDPQVPATLAAEAVRVNKDGSISIKTGAIITGIVSVISLIGTQGIDSVLKPWLGDVEPHPAVIERLDAQDETLARLEEQLNHPETGLAARQAQSAKLTSLIYKIVRKANPDVELTLEDLGVDPE